MFQDQSKEMDNNDVITSILFSGEQMGKYKKYFVFAKCIYM
jgi:hypothetical protein